MDRLLTPVLRLWPFILFLFMLLSGCTPSVEPPFHIRKLSFSATPTVGKVTDLVIEVANNQNTDATPVYIWIDPSDGVHIINQGTLEKDPKNEWIYRLKTIVKANSKATYRVPICVIKEGDQRIIVNARRILTETSVLGESETINIINYGTTNRVVSGNDYRYTPFPRGYQTPTPIPVTLSAECMETE